MTTATKTKNEKLATINEHIAYYQEELESGNGSTRKAQILENLKAEKEELEKSIEVGDFVEYQVPYFERFFTYFAQVKEIDKSGLARLRYIGTDGAFLGHTFQYVSQLKITDNLLNVEALQELGCNEIF